MNNIEKKLDALIDALGFDVEQVNVNPMRYDRYPSEPIYDYKLTKRVTPQYTIHPDDIVETIKNEEQVPLFNGQTSVLLNMPFNRIYIKHDYLKKDKEHERLFEKRDFEKEGGIGVKLFNSYPEGSVLIARYIANE